MRCVVPLLGLLTAAACVLGNPEFDENSGSGTGTAGGTEATATTATTATTGAGSSSSGAAAVTGGSDSASASGTTTSTDATTDATTDASGTGSSGDAGCLARCPACSECVDGACVPAPPGGACGEPIECSDFVAGVDDSVPGELSCLAYAAGEVFGACDGEGSCVEATVDQCAGEGEPIVTCDPLCALSPEEIECVVGAEAATIHVTSLCVTEAGAPMCAPTCNVFPEEHFESGSICDGEGWCGSLGPASCGDYVCVDEVGCLDSCDGPEDCVEGDCIDNACVD